MYDSGREASNNAREPMCVIQYREVLIGIKKWFNC